MQKRLIVTGLVLVGAVVIILMFALVYPPLILQLEYNGSIKAKRQTS
jgi:hypothetical protein